MFNELLHSFKVSTTDITGTWEEPIKFFQWNIPFEEKPRKTHVLLPKCYKVLSDFPFKMSMFSRLYYEAIACRDETPFKSWIKLLSPRKLVPLDLYDRREDFHKVADIVLDTDTKPNGTKKRQTVIKFETTIDKNDWSSKCEWLYLFIIAGNIVKIGGTRDGLKSRCASYNCGHHIPERGRSGDCSKTNGFIYNTLEFYLKLGFDVEMYGYKINPQVLSVPIFDDEWTQVTAQVFHAYESRYIERFRCKYGFLPALCDNSDPTYRAISSQQ